MSSPNLQPHSSSMPNIPPGGSSTGSTSAAIGLLKPTQWHVKKSPQLSRETTSLMFDALVQPIPPKGENSNSRIEGHSNLYVWNDSTDVITESRASSLDGSDKEVVVSEGPKQNSFVTVFSIWNTMMGTSILAMPWTLQQAGFGFGVFLILLVASIACYTAYLVIKTTDDIRTIQSVSTSVSMDIADACHYHFGKAGRIIALVFSQISLLGASIVYYVLLTNFLFYTGEYIYQSVTNQFPTPPNIEGNTKNISNILCPPYSKPSNETTEKGSDLYHKLWIQDRTVPAWLLLIIFPLISIKSPTCLGKFTALATVSVTYLFILVGIKGYGWGVNMSTPPLVEPVLQYRNYFPALTGTCSMAFYIHNALHTIMRAQKHPENNVRDVAIAFAFATATYAFMGTIFFIIFPVSKLCIEDNFLNNLTTDIPVFIGRLALLFQMSMVYPMIVYILRAQIMHAIFGNTYPSWYSVLILHILIVAIGLLFSILYPSIGTIIRFIGALCGLVYVFTIPTVITLMNKWVLGHTKNSPTASSNETGQDSSLFKEPLDRQPSGEWKDRRTKRMWYLRCGFYVVIILLGLANFIAQFVLLAFE